MQGAFFAKISDAAIGGTYLTLLNTVSNFGGTWPKFLIYRVVDMLTVSACIPSAHDSLPDSLRFASCHDDSSMCVAAGGVCAIERDGYVWVSLGLIVIGYVPSVSSLAYHRMALLPLLRSLLLPLEHVDASHWGVSDDSNADEGKKSI